MLTFEKIKALKIEYRMNPEFTTLNAEDVLAEPMPAGGLKPVKCPADLPAFLKALYEWPILTREQEVYLFRRMNFLFYTCSETQSLQTKGATLRLRFWNRCYSEAMKTRDLILKSNLRIVIHCAKQLTQDANTFDAFVSEGNTVLFRAVARFDYSLGNKLSTFAFCAVKKRMWRVFTTAEKDKIRCMSINDLVMDDPDGNGTMRPTHFTQSIADKFDGPTETAELSEEIASVVHLLDSITGKEKFVLEHRYGLNGNEALTLKETGKLIGVTRERVRQIEKKALLKMRKADARRRNQASSSPEQISLPNGRLCPAGDWGTRTG